MSKSDNLKHRLDQEVQQTFESLDNIDNIEAGPFFYAKLNARIEESHKTNETWIARLLLGGRLAPSLLTVAVLLNVYTAVMVVRDKSASQIDLREEYLEAVADEYLLTGTSSWSDIASE